MSNAPGSAKQVEYWHNANRRWNIKTGATRSGKTYMDFFLLPKRLLAVSGKEGINVMLGNTRETLHRNVIIPMQALYGAKRVSNIRTSDNSCTMFGQRVICLGASKIDAQDKLRGMSIKYCYGDEVSTWHKTTFDMLKSRLDKPYSKFDGTCNPDAPNHWFHQFLQSDADIYQQAYCIDDNPFLDPAFVEQLKTEYRGTVYYKRYIQGLWVAAEGSVYPLFAADPGRYIIDAEPADIAYCIIGLDFGGTGSAHAINLTGISADYRQVYTLDEYYLKKQVTPQALQDAFIAFVQKARSKYRVYEAYMDSAEQTLIAGMRSAAIRAHLPIDIKNAQKRPILDRIRFYTRLMGADRYKVMRHCTNTIAAFEQSVYDMNKEKDTRLDDGTYNVDSLDAQQYSTESVMDAIITRM